MVLRQDVKSTNILCHLFYNMILDFPPTIFLDSKERQVDNDITNKTTFEEHQGLFEL
jgi:hypothetical protein